MKKIRPFLCAALSELMLTALTAPVSAAEEDSMLQFDENGEFRILVVADTQDTATPQEATLRLLNAELDAADADLVVFTGDQVHGPSVRTEAAMEKALDAILAPVAERGIPFAAVFGNHDDEGGVSKETQLAIYQSYPGCLMSAGPDDITGCGNYNLLVWSSDGSRPMCNLWFLDSGTYGEKGVSKYARIEQDQIDWYTSTAAALKEQYGEMLPAYLFQHIIVPEIYDLLTEVPAGAQFILLPETAVPRHYWEPGLTETRFDNEPGPFWQELADTLRSSHPQALLVTGAFTNRYYAAGLQPRTAVGNPYGDGYYDDFNTAVGLDSAGRTQLHHKGKLVIGVENTPTVIFDLMQFLVIDLGGVVGQIGMGQHGTAFAHAGMRMGPAICYEGLYGDFYGDFVRRGAQFMAIISNDGWWGDTPGYKHLFTISRLRAIEHRRAIARSANTGMSGFISARGDIGETLGWEKRGVISAAVPLNSELTFYTRYGDYLGRISEYLTLLCVLYYIAYRVKRKNYLVK